MWQRVWQMLLDQLGLTYDFGSGGDKDIAVELGSRDANAIVVEGIRGKGWFVDPLAGPVHLTLRGMTSNEGSLEFWMRPVNWDDMTGFWKGTAPKPLLLSVMRLYGRNEKTRAGELFMSIVLPRGWNFGQRLGHVGEAGPPQVVKGEFRHARLFADVQRPHDQVMGDGIRQRRLLVGLDAIVLKHALLAQHAHGTADPARKQGRSPGDESGALVLDAGRCPGED